MHSHEHLLLVLVLLFLWQRATGHHTDEGEWGWVETEDDIRGRAKNAKSGHSYYGIKGVPRQSNHVIVGACCLLILVGCGYFYIGFK